MRWAAMLRGINLGKRQLRKDALIAAAQASGFSDARTLLASGNLAFEAGGMPGEEIEQRLQAAVERLHDIESDVFARNSAELAGVVAANPFPDAASERPAKLVVTFHRAAFPQSLLATLSNTYLGPERLTAVDRELFIDFPLGQGESALVPAMTKHRFPSGTGRNWNTVLKLQALLEG